MLAVLCDPHILRYVPDVLKVNNTLVLAAVSKQGETLAFAGKELQADRDIVLAAIKNDGKALKFASKELQGDKDIVMSVIQNNGDALEFASRELREDIEIVTAAVHSSPFALVWASEELQDTETLVMECFRIAYEEARQDDELDVDHMEFFESDVLSFASDRISEAVRMLRYQERMADNARSRYVRPRYVPAYEILQTLRANKRAKSAKM